MESNAGKLLTAFLSILIGVILLVVISNEVVSMTGTTQVTGETINVASARTGGTKISVLETTQFPIANRPYASGVVLTNGTGGTIAGTAYVFTEGGNDAFSYITLVNGTYWEGSIGPSGNTTTIAYKYYKLRDGWSRTVLNVAPGFIAMAIMGVGVALLYSMYKENL